MATKTLLCRICLQSVPQSNSTSLFMKSEINKQCSNADIIMEICSVTLNDDTFAHICLVCLNNSHVAYEFKRLCEESDRAIRQNPDLLRDDFEDKTIKTEMVTCEMDVEPLKEVDEKVDVKKPRIRRYRCVVCGCFHETDDGFKEHIKTHFGPEGAQCSACDMVFDTYNKIKVHVSKAHRTRNRKRRLQEESNAEKNKKHLCPYCGWEFLLAGNLTQHMMKHENRKRFACDKCDKKFYFMYRLKKHEKIWHANERNFKCDVCGEQFALEEQLKRHGVSHMTERNHPCPVCKKNFQTQNHVKSHMKYHREKKLVCEFCEKTFSCKKYLLVHTYTHTGERPQVCHLCSKGFAQWTSLNYHIAKHHPDAFRKMKRTRAATLNITE